MISTLTTWVITLTVAGLAVGLICVFAAVTGVVVDIMDDATRR